MASLAKPEDLSLNAEEALIFDPGNFVILCP